MDVLSGIKKILQEDVKEDHPLGVLVERGVFKQNLHEKMSWMVNLER